MLSIKLYLLILYDWQASKKKFYEHDLYSSVINIVWNNFEKNKGEDSLAMLQLVPKSIMPLFEGKFLQNIQLSFLYQLINWDPQIVTSFFGYFGRVSSILSTFQPPSSFAPIRLLTESKVYFSKWWD